MEKLKFNIFKPFHNTCQFLNSHFNFVQGPTMYVADLIYRHYICVLYTCICYKLRITIQHIEECQRSCSNFFEKMDMFARKGPGKCKEEEVMNWRGLEL